LSKPASDLGFTHQSTYTEAASYNLKETGVNFIFRQTQNGRLQFYFFQLPNFSKTIAMRTQRLRRPCDIEIQFRYVFFTRFEVDRYAFQIIA